MGQPPLAWDRDGQHWPNREASRFVDAGGLTWHVQVAGDGPVLLLLHGTGASAHSWRDLLPRLATRFTVVAPDLPGHAFTTVPPPHGMSLPGMAAGVAALLGALALRPAVVVGHSAGAAVAAWMMLEHAVDPAGLFSFNGALLPIGGIAGQVFSPLARTLAGSRLAAEVFSWWAGDRATVKRMLDQTGSRLDARGLELYHRLARSAAHTHGALAMMANWDVGALAERLPALAKPVVLVVGTKDRSVPPSDAERLRQRLPEASIEPCPGLGHLAHEEAPEAHAEIIERNAAAWGIPFPSPARAGEGVAAKP